MRLFQLRFLVPLGLGVSLGLLPHLGCSANAASTTTLRQASVARDTAPSVSSADQATLALDNARFAFSLWNKVVTDDTSNVVYSPISMSIALSMAYAATSGPTATQMASVMQWSLPASQLFPPSISSI